MIISILNQKGGVGKTTLAVNLARGYKCKGMNPILVDSDPQGSARDWHEISGGELINIIAMDRGTLSTDIDIVKGNFSPVIIDGAPRIEKLSTAAIIASDLILIPVQPSPYDIWATGNLVSLIKQRQDITGGYPKAVFVISRVIKNTHLSKNVQEALMQYGFPTLQSVTTQLVSYPTTANLGQTVYEGNNQQAKQEIENIISELKEKGYFTGPDYFSGTLTFRAPCAA